MNPDLRTFIDRVSKETPGDLLMVKEVLDLRYEPTAYIDELAKKGKHPVFIFESLKGAKFPVVTNVLGTRKRYALALGTTEDKIMAEWFLRSQRVIPPRAVKEAPIKDCIQTGGEVDLGSLPVLTHFQDDGGPYITSGIVVAKDPDTGIRNASFHRCQLKDRNTLGVSLHSRRHLWDYQRRAEDRRQEPGGGRSHRMSSANSISGPVFGKDRSTWTNTMWLEVFSTNPLK